MNEKPRKPRARHRDTVLGCIEERVSMIQGAENAATAARLLELLDELRRAMGKGKDE